VATPAGLNLSGPGAGRPDVIMLDLYHDGDAPCLDAIPQLCQDCKVLVVSAFGRPTGSTRSHAATTFRRAFALVSADVLDRVLGAWL
jgi:hypothetical protein